MTESLKLGGIGLLRKIFLTETTEPLPARCKKSISLAKEEAGSVLSEVGGDDQLSRNGICFEWGNPFKLGNDSKVDLSTHQSERGYGPQRGQRI